MEHNWNQHPSSHAPTSPTTDNLDIMYQQNVSRVTPTSRMYHHPPEYSIPVNHASIPQSYPLNASSHQRQSFLYPQPQLPHHLHPSPQHMPSSPPPQQPFQLRTTTGEIQAPHLHHFPSPMHVIGQQCVPPPMLSPNSRSHLQPMLSPNTRTHQVLPHFIDDRMNQPHLSLPSGITSGNILSNIPTYEHPQPQSDAMDLTKVDTARSPNRSSTCTSNKTYGEQGSELTGTSTEESSTKNIYDRYQDIFRSGIGVLDRSSVIRPTAASQTTSRSPNKIQRGSGSPKPKAKKIVIVREAKPVEIEATSRAELFGKASSLTFDNPSSPVKSKTREIPESTMLNLSAPTQVKGDAENVVSQSEQGKDGDVWAHMRNIITDSFEEPSIPGSSNHDQLVGTEKSVQNQVESTNVPADNTEEFVGENSANVEPVKMDPADDTDTAEKTFIDLDAKDLQPKDPETDDNDSGDAEDGVKMPKKGRAKGRRRKRRSRWARKVTKPTSDVKLQQDEKVEEEPATTSQQEQARRGRGSSSRGRGRGRGARRAALGRLESKSGAENDDDADNRRTTRSRSARNQTKELPKYNENSSDEDILNQLLDQEKYVPNYPQSELEENLDAQTSRAHAPEPEMSGSDKEPQSHQPESSSKQEFGAVSVPDIENRQVSNRGKGRTSTGRGRGKKQIPGTRLFSLPDSSENSFQSQNDLPSTNNGVSSTAIQKMNVAKGGRKPRKSASTASFTHEAEETQDESSVDPVLLCLDIPVFAKNIRPSYTQEELKLLFGNKRFVMNMADFDKVPGQMCIWQIFLEEKCLRQYVPGKHAGRQFHISSPIRWYFLEEDFLSEGFFLQFQPIYVVVANERVVFPETKLHKAMVESEVHFVYPDRSGFYRIIKQMGRIHKTEYLRSVFKETHYIISVLVMYPDLYDLVSSPGHMAQSLKPQINSKKVIDELIQKTVDKALERSQYSDETKKFLRLFPDMRYSAPKKTPRRSRNSSNANRCSACQHPRACFVLVTFSVDKCGENPYHPITLVELPNEEIDFELPNEAYSWCRSCAVSARKLHRLIHFMHALLGVTRQNMARDATKLKKLGSECSDMMLIWLQSIENNWIYTQFAELQICLAEVETEFNVTLPSVKVEESIADVKSECPPNPVTSSAEN